MGQYIPRISQSDIARVVERDFAPEVRQTVVELIEKYGQAEHETEVLRVRMAVLKVSAAISMIEENVAKAKEDYRDILIVAESPRISEVGFLGLGQMKKSEIEDRYEQDKQQYLSWLNRR